MPAVAVVVGAVNGVVLGVEEDIGDGELNWVSEFNCVADCAVVSRGNPVVPRDNVGAEKRERGACSEVREDGAKFQWGEHPPGEKVAAEVGERKGIRSDGRDRELNARRMFELADFAGVVVVDYVERREAV